MRNHLGIPRVGRFLLLLVSPPFGFVFGFRFQTLAFVPFVRDREIDRVIDANAFAGSRPSRDPARQKATIRSALPRRAPPSPLGARWRRPRSPILTSPGSIPRSTAFCVARRVGASTSRIETSAGRSTATRAGTGFWRACFARRRRWWRLCRPRSRPRAVPPPRKSSRRAEDLRAQAEHGRARRDVVADRVRPPRIAEGVHPVQVRAAPDRGVGVPAARQARRGVRRPRRHRAERPRAFPFASRASGVAPGSSFAVRWFFGVTTRGTTSTSSAWTSRSPGAPPRRGSGSAFRRGTCATAKASSAPRAGRSTTPWRPTS